MVFQINLIAFSAIKDYKAGNYQYLIVIVKQQY